MVKTHKNCLICSSDKLFLLERYKSAHLCKCKNCGFIFQNIPSETELNNFYDYYEERLFISITMII